MREREKTGDRCNEEKCTKVHLFGKEEKKREHDLKSHTLQSSEIKIYLSWSSSLFLQKNNNFKQRYNEFPLIDIEIHLHRHLRLFRSSQRRKCGRNEWAEESLQILLNWLDRRTCCVSEWVSECGCVTWSAVWWHAYLTSCGVSLQALFILCLFITFTCFSFWFQLITSLVSSDISAKKRGAAAVAAHVCIFILLLSDFVFCHTLQFRDDGHHTILHGEFSVYGCGVPTRLEWIGIVRRDLIITRYTYNQK